MLSQFEMDVLQFVIKLFQGDSDAPALAEMVLKLTDSEGKSDDISRQSEKLALTALLAAEMKKNGREACFLELVETLDAYLNCDEEYDKLHTGFEFESSPQWKELLSDNDKTQRKKIMDKLYFNRLRGFAFFGKEQPTLVD